MKREMKGLGISPGFVLGELWKREEELALPQRCNDTEDQLQSFHQVLTQVREENEERSKDPALTPEEAEIFEAHDLMLMDPEWIGEIEEMIKEKYCAAYAIAEVSKQMAATLEALDDEYLAERARDIRDIGKQLTRKLGDVDTSLDRYEGKLLWMEELLASEVKDLVDAGVLAVLTQSGGRTSHAAILAKSFKLPYVSGIHPESLSGVQGHVVGLDAHQGILYLDPDLELQEEIKRKKQKEIEDDRYFSSLRQSKTESKDGKKRQVSGNIAGPEDIPALLEEGAEGVALYRTEFLFLKDRLPTEEEQVEIYKEVFIQLKGLPITVRTLDIGGDKASASFSIEKEENPFLGVRGIRLSFLYSDVLKTQLRALLQSALGHEVHIMFPMVSSLDDVLRAKEIFNQAKAELEEEGKSFSEQISLGVMIEVPSAALSVPSMVGEIDFISIGTNDLIQYTLAADRMNQQVEEYYDAYNPGLLRLIHLCTKEAKEAGIAIAMCGDLAGEESLSPLWNAMGVEEYGVVSSKITRIRHQLLSSNAENEELIQNILKAKTSDEVKEILRA